MVDRVLVSRHMMDTAIPLPHQPSQTFARASRDRYTAFPRPQISHRPISVFPRTNVPGSSTPVSG
ncbi:MAG: hypothetical protein WC993_06150 [Methanoculleus sp.]